MKLDTDNIGLGVAVVGALSLVFAISITTQKPNVINNASNAMTGNMADHHSGGNGNKTYTSLQDNLVGKPSPSFSLSDRDGKTYTSDNLKGKNVILFFNEGIMCYPACWNQIAAFPKDERFKKDDLVVLSVVVDPKENWEKAVKRMPDLAQATVVFDNGAAVSKQFGVLTTPSSMHYGSLPGHTYVVIDKAGVVKHVFDDPNMAIHNDQLVSEIAKLNS